MSVYQSTYRRDEQTVAPSKEPVSMATIGPRHGRQIVHTERFNVRYLSVTQDVAYSKTMESAMVNG